ncbi:hypothetical protein K505DRAFT_123353 [Melanomma pulvis-pyrius CBS 109.77]|uniref:Uncharacterized protein n=1 Tax=Melanomma pulvis-pyrius CBS 109.77 TaxID=1314802 RepID=A0A6A6WUA1_9PLEO|nr:hypothetical protein K505DRAFT_123353 [Melanomma pulvis-pyrius CBS 109.77]
MFSCGKYASRRPTLSRMHTSLTSLPFPNLAKYRSHVPFPMFNFRLPSPILQFLLPPSST